MRALDVAWLYTGVPAAHAAAAARSAAVVSDHSGLILATSEDVYLCLTVLRRVAVSTNRPRAIRV